MDHHFKPLFNLKPANGHEAEHERFTLGHIDVQVPAGCREKEWGHVERAEMDRRGQEILRTATAMRHLSIQIPASDVMKSSNGSLSTLESEEMLSPKEASKLSATNAPLMSRSPCLKKSVEPPTGRRAPPASGRRTTW